MRTPTLLRPASVLTAVAVGLGVGATGVLAVDTARAATADTYRMTVAPTPHVSPDGTRWEARTGFTGGDFSRSYDSGTIRGAADSALYHPELVRFSAWSKPVADGTYRVTLKMREQWWTRPGQRVFDVSAEGRPVLADVDIVAAVGKDAAYDRSFTVTVTDGRLDLGFTADVDSPLLSALEIVRTGAAPAPAPTTPRVPTDGSVGRTGAGPAPVTDAAGNVYAAASGFDGGSVWTPPRGTVVRGTPDQAVYLPERVRMTRWSRAVPNGTYEVTLKMRESYYDRPGVRVFDVHAEGTRVLADVDIHKAVGRNTAYDRTFRTRVEDGRLDLRWAPKKNVGIVSAVVWRKVAAPTPTTPAPTTPAPTTPTPVTSGSYGRLSGMAWDSGMYPMNRAGEVTAWEASRGRKVDVVTVFPSRESWDAMQSTWFMDDQRIPTGYRGTLDVGVPLWPNDGNLAAAKAGAYDAQWEKLARAVAATYPNAYIRLGWEMNLPGWKAAAYAHTAEDWKTAYRRAVTAIRKGGPDLRIAWVVNEGPGQTGTPDARVFYPGDAYVDVIGMDAYDWDPPYTTEANIARHRDGAYGWNFWLDFAKSRGKRFVLPEWGIARANPGGGGDNPRYIAFVYDWLKKNRDHIAYESYFDESEPYIRSDLFTGYNPKASAEYRRWMPLLGR